MNEMKVIDRFVWKKVTEQARELYGIFELFVVDESDAVIESYSALLNWLDKGYDVYIEVGHLPKEEESKESHNYTWSLLDIYDTNKYIEHGIKLNTYKHA